MIFDGEAKLITLTTTTLDVVQMWSGYLNWLAFSDNTKFPVGMRSLGGDVIDLTSGTKVPAYVYLLNGWKIRPMESNHTLNTTNGILLVDGGGDPFVNTIGAFNIRINYSQPVQAITVATGGSGGATPAQIWDYAASSAGTVGSVGEVLNKTKQSADNAFAIGAAK
jgi:hypothetical protein